VSIRPEDLIDYFASRGQRPLKTENLKFAVVIHPWWVGKTKRPVRGLDYSDIIVGNPETMEIIFARNHSRPFQGGSFSDGIKQGGARRGLTPGIPRASLIEVLPPEFDYESDCVAWFDELTEAEACSEALRKLLKS
jgi:hypothetical protein